MIVEPVMLKAVLNEIKWAKLKNSGVLVIDNKIMLESIETVIERSMLDKMDKNIAVSIIYEVINSDILREDLEDSLVKIAKAIETDNWTREIKEPGNGRGC